MIKKYKQVLTYFKYKGETPDCAQNVIVDIWIFQAQFPPFFSQFLYLLMKFKQWNLRKSLEYI